MRVKDWEAALAAELRRHAGMPFGYGESDCFLVCADAVKAITGIDPYPDARRYRTETGAAKALRQHGFTTIVDAWAAKFREINRLSAMRGDICIVDGRGAWHGPAGAIWNGREAFTKGPDGNVLLALDEVRQVFRVE